MGVISKKTMKELFTGLLKIRIVETKVVEVYQEKMMRTPTHLSIGQEAVAVGVCYALKKEDQVFASHRCHAEFLARGGRWDEFFAELCGRETGICKGRAGSAHLTDCEINVCSSPILGSMIPVAVGAALSFRMDRKNNVAVAFLGDAAIEEGVFSESLNFAVLKKLPVLFICENNLYSTHSPLKVRQPLSPIFKRIRTPELKTLQIDGNDVLKVYETVREALAGCRKGQGPVFIECLTYRIREHVGTLMDYDRGYRSKKEVEAWMKKCPLKKMERIIIKKDILSKPEIERLSRELGQEAESSYRKALNSPWPKKETLLDHVY